MVAFSQVPASFRTFGIHVEHDNSQANQAPPGMEHLAIVIAPQLLTIHSEGEVVPIASGPAADAAFGVGSMAAQMCRAFIRQTPYVPLVCAPLDDEAGGTQATGDIDFTGTATESGELALYIAGRRIAVAVANGDTAANVETKALAAVQAADVAATLPVTAAADGVNDGIDLTARHKGTFGDQIDLRHSHNPGERPPAGISVSITAMNGGATDPAITDVLNALSPTAVHNTIVHPYTDATNLTSIEGDMDARWNAMDQRNGHAFTAAVDTQGNLTTLGNGRNNQHSTIFGIRSPTPPWEIAAQVAAAEAGHADPAMPRRGTILRDVVAPSESEEFTRTQRDILLHDGIATGVTVGGRVQIERLTTTYQVNGSSVPDPSYLDVNTLRISEFIDFQIRAHFSSRYAKAKVAKDGFRSGPGQLVLTPTVAISEMLGLCRLWLQAAIIERMPDIEAGELVASVNGGDPNRMDIGFSPDYMNQFRGMAVLNSFQR